jgi:hypothetical protein
MRRLAFALTLALVAPSCTLLNSRDGISGPPLGVDGDDASIPDGASSIDGAIEPEAAPPKDAATDGDAALEGPVTLFVDQAGVSGIAAFGGAIYWVAGQPRGLLKASRDGGAITHVDDVTQPVGDAFDIAVDATHAYWTTRADGKVMRRPLAGGANEPCFTTGTTAAYIALGGGGAYVTDFREDVLGVGSVFRGSCGQASSIAFAKQPRSTGIALFAQLVYWGRNQPDSVAFGAPDGGAGATFHESFGAVSGIAVDGDYLYWIRENRRLMRFSFTSRAEEELYDAGSPFGGGDVAVDDRAVYWTETTRGVVKTIRKRAASGG